MTPVRRTARRARRRQLAVVCLAVAASASADSFTPIRMTTHVTTVARAHVPLRTSVSVSADPGVLDVAEGNLQVEVKLAPGECGANFQTTPGVTLVNAPLTPTPKTGQAYRGSAAGSGRPTAFGTTDAVRVPRGRRRRPGVRQRRVGLGQRLPALHDAGRPLRHGARRRSRAPSASSGAPSARRPRGAAGSARTSPSAGGPPPPTGARPAGPAARAWRCEGAASLGVSWRVLAAAACLTPAPRRRGADHRPDDGPRVRHRPGERVGRHDLRAGVAGALPVQDADRRRAPTCPTTTAPATSPTTTTSR